MKRLMSILLWVALLSGCAREGDLEDVLSLRSQLLASPCSFDTRITADYGDMVYLFSLHCDASPDGSVRFQVTSPESIVGIGGSLSADGGKLTFDDTALAFGLLADGQISPVGAPYVLMKALLGGYVTTYGKDGDTMCVTIRDSYADDALTVDLWLKEQTYPIRAEILYDGRRILTMELENFAIG